MVTMTAAPVAATVTPVPGGPGRHGGSRGGRAGGGPTRTRRRVHPGLETGPGPGPATSQAGRCHGLVKFTDSKLTAARPSRLPDSVVRSEASESRFRGILRPGG